MNILFMCVANSARSQLAQALAQQIFGNKAAIHSAGSTPTLVNPYALQVLEEVGADCKALYSKTVDSLPPDFLAHIDYVITLCAEEVCPVYISKAQRLHWPLPDPARQDEKEEDQIRRFRQTRDEIRKKLENFAGELSQ